MVETYTIQSRSRTGGDRTSLEGREHVEAPIEVVAEGRGRQHRDPEHTRTGEVAA